MAIPDQERPTSGWRMRAFIQPLLLTIVGVAVSVGVAAIAAGGAFGCAASDPGCGDFLLGAFSRAVLGFAVGLLITGFAVGVSSRDSRLASRAVLVAVSLLWLGLTIFVIVGDASANGPDAGRVVDDLVWSGVAALLFAIPVGLGFWVGRRVRLSRG